MDESTMYRSAYATAQTLGATPENLVASAQRYLAVLKKEEAKFNAALVSQRRKQIDGGLGEVKSFEQSIEDKRNQIEQLKKEVAASEAKLVEMKTEIQEANLKIETTQQDFVASYGNLVSQITKDVENINKYLK
jgi:peptidoglycan hydrolase CwlO-like protein